MGVSPRFGAEEAARRRLAWAAEWQAAAASREPADRPRAEAAIRSLYAAAGRPAPEVHWAPSPAAGLVVSGFLAVTHPRIGSRWARGDIGNGANRSFNGLAEPFGLEPVWEARLARQVAEAAGAGASGGADADIRGAARALGLEGTGRSMLAVRASLGPVDLPRPAIPDGPAATAVAAAVLGDAWTAIVGTMGEALARGVWAETLRTAAESVLRNDAGRREAVQAMQPGQWDGVTPVLAAGQAVFGGYLWRHRAGRTERERAIHDRLQLARSAGPWWAHRDVAVVSERPLVNRVDDQGRPHAIDGPALAWADGTTVHAIHGVVVDEPVVRDPASITVEQIDRESNAEVRRVLVERFGLERLVREGGATLVAEDETGRLWRRELGTAWRRDEPVVVVEVRNRTPEPDGSYRTYLLRVPPATRTAREGVAWTFGLPAWVYAPSRET